MRPQQQAAAQHDDEQHESNQLDLSPSRRVCHGGILRVQAPRDHFPLARTTSLAFIAAWPVPQYSEHVMSNVPA